MFELFIARRYLRAKRKQVMISVITLISVIGVAAGVMALVIALAITTGFSQTLQRNLLGLTAHVSIQEKQPSDGITGWREIVAQTSRLPHVILATPVLYEPGFISGVANSSGLTLKGILPDPSHLPTPLVHLKTGSIAAIQGDSRGPGIILGARLADSIGAAPGKVVTLTAPGFGPFGPRPKFIKFVVAGTFETGFFEADYGFGFAALNAVQQAYDLEGDVVNSVELRLDDVYKAPEVESAAEKIIDPKLTALTWEEQNRSILEAFATEKIVTVITIGLIMLVAALNILNALVMMVMEKNRDIAVLMSMGTRASQIRNIFVLEGALIGSVGTAIGLIVGYTLCYFADHYHWIALNEQVYQLAYVPFNVRAIDGVWIAAGALAVSLLATLYPARSATKIAPVEALRYE